MPLEPDGSASSVEAARAFGLARGRTSIWRPYLLPALLAAVLIVMSVVSAVALRVAENRGLERVTATQLGHVIGELNKGIDLELHSLFPLAWRWSVLQGGEQGFALEAISLVEESPWLRGLIWVDGHGEARAASPSREYWDQIRELPGFEASSRKIFTSLGAEGGVGGLEITLPKDRGAGLAALLSLNSVGQSGVFVVGIYDTRALLAQIFRNESPDFSVSVSGPQGALWSRSEGFANPNFSRSGEVLLLGLPLFVSVTPGPRLISTYLTWQPTGVAVAGVLFALLSAVSISMAFQNKQRAEKLAEVNRELTHEADLRTRAEMGEMEAKTELEEVLEQLPVHVWSAYSGPDGVMAPLRHIRMPQLTGRPVEEYKVWPDSWYETVVAEDRDALRQLIDDLIAGRKSGGDIEYRIVDVDGTVIHLADSIRSRPEGEGRRLAGVIRDVTQIKEAEAERQRLEGRFEQTQKLESLGVLAGGIAHDFNNLLVGVLGHARLAAEDLPKTSPVQKSIQSIDRAARRAADLCRQMLAYAGKAPVSIQPIDLRESVEEMGELLRASIPASSVIEYEFEQDLPAVKADGSQLQQVVLNLITNASEAIGDAGGKITLSVGSRIYTGSELAQMDFGEDLKPGRFVVLSVEDSGSGMDDETRRRIFEPFYTTKFTGRGLGLAAVIGIVRGHGGGIQIESKPGAGTCMRVAFPATDMLATPEPELTKDSTWRGSGKVLIVEDEDSARELAATVLGRVGFEVLEASDGLEGVEIFRQNKEDIRCVLLDLAMPKMDGDEAHRHIRSLRADVPTLLCSGYPEQDAVARFSDLSSSGFIEKPYSPELLIAKVRAALQSLD